GVQAGDPEAANLAGAKNLLPALRGGAALPALLEHRAERGEIGFGRARADLFPGGFRGQAAGSVDAFAELDFGAAARDIGHTAGDDIALFVFRDVFIQAGGDQLLHAEPQTALARIDLQDLRLHDLPDLEYFLRVINAPVRGDIAHMHHALDTLGDLH